MIHVRIRKTNITEDILHNLRKFLEDSILEPNKNGRFMIQLDEESWNTFVKLDHRHPEWRGLDFVLEGNGKTTSD